MAHLFSGSNQPKQPADDKRGFIQLIFGGEPLARQIFPNSQRQS
jgi:hypothetical protein